MKTPIIIYSLSDPLTDDIKYIGKTKNLKARYGQHCSPVLKNGDKDIWVYCLQTQGLKPIISIIEICSQSDSSEREIYHIRSHIEKGCILFNKQLLSRKLSKISIVLPDGTIDKLKSIALFRGISVNDLVLEFINISLSNQYD